MANKNTTTMVALVLISLASASIFLPSAYGISVVTTVTVGDGPIGVGINPTTNEIYVVNTIDADVNVINGATDTNTGTSIPVGDSDDPSGVVVNPATNEAYVANFFDNDVTAIDGLTKTVITTIPVGGQPTGMALNEALNEVYVANSDDDTLSIINGVTKAVTDTVPLTNCDFPHDVAYNIALNEIWIVCMNNDSVVVLDRATLTEVAGSPILVGDDPHSIVINPVTIPPKAYVTNRGPSDGSNPGPDTVSVINTSTKLIVATVPVGDQPRGIDVNIDPNHVFVANGGNSTSVSVIDGATDVVVDTVETGQTGWGLAVNPATDKVYVSHRFALLGDDIVSVILDTPVAPEQPETIVKCYGILTQDPVINPTVPVTIQDQFGTETVDLNAPARICEEGLKHSTAPPPNPRHWIQYEYVGSRDPGQIVVADQFGSETVEPLFSFDLLVPAAKEGQSPLNIQHWTDYLIAGTVDPSPVIVTDQFGTSVIDLGTPFVFSSTSTKNGVGDLNGPDMKCYNIDSEEPVIDPVPHEFSDQFGASIIDPTAADFLCVIAQKRLIEAPVGGELLSIDMTTLFIAGAFANASWTISTIAVAAAGIIGLALRKRIKSYKR